MPETEEKPNLYSKRKDFNQTPEPGGGGTVDWTGGRPVFVVQMHAASTLHYDFRIEVDGVLKSWAVPKGPPTDPKQKRLAIPTEDHPLEYAEFEGVIPEGAYGGGTVLIWDWGNYRDLRQGDSQAASVARQIEEGHVAIWLNGQRLSGGYALIRAGREDDARWLLIKMNDDEADARRNPTSTETRSVKSGRTLDEIRKEAENLNDPCPQRTKTQA